MPMRVSFAVALVLLLGCSNKPSSACGLTAACRVAGVTGSMPGVRLTVFADRCTLAPGAPATFHYEVEVDAAAPAIDVQESQGCGPCTSPSADPLSFTSVRISSPGGGEPHYCVCDTGCCPPLAAQTIHLREGKASAVLEWPGRAWNGPSDTGQPLGAQFGPGCYAVTVRLDGGASGEVVATLPIEVVALND